jgi:hypothetical protein
VIPLKSARSSNAEVIPSDPRIGARSVFVSIPKSRAFTRAGPVVIIGSPT